MHGIKPKPKGIKFSPNKLNSNNMKMEKKNLNKKKKKVLFINTIFLKENNIDNNEWQIED